MKSIDVDAKHMIRNYIDSIEEYLRKHTRLHPNEIDNLLNEINDFVYIRSEELAADEERVSYADVLKAIEECGSPSEICEQYLEQEETGEGQEPIIKKIAESENSKTVSTKVEGQSIGKTSFTTRRDWLKHRFRIPSRATSVYRSSTGFGLYRIVFLLCFGSILLSFILYNFRDYIFNYNLYQMISHYQAITVSYNLCGAITLFAFTLLFWEGWVINKWKWKLKKEQGMDLSLDDSMLVWIARFSFIIAFCKASLLFYPVYIWYAPIWFVLVIIFEKQLQSSLWTNQVAPWITTVGKRLLAKENSDRISRQASIWERIKSKSTLRETILVIVLLGFFGVTFFFPWTFLVGAVISGFEGFVLKRVFDSVLGFGIISILLLLLPLLNINFYKMRDKSFFDSETFQFYYSDSGLTVWSIRLLAIKSILIVTTFERYSQQYLPIVFILVLLLIFSEISLNTYGGNSIRYVIATLLVRLGSSEPLFKIRDDIDIQVEKRNGLSDQGAPSKTISTKTVPRPITQSMEPTSLELMEREPSLFRKFLSRLLSKTGSAFSLAFTGIKIIMLTIGMLFIAFYEVILASMILLTSFSSDGSYYVPVFRFDDPSLPGGSVDSIIYLGGFTIWAWYALLLLGIQVVYIALIQFSSLVLKEPEGVVVRVGQNLSRIFLFTMFISSIIQFSYFGDSYALFRILIIIGLAIFGELTTWKVRAERKQWQPHINRGQKNQNKNTLSSTNAEIS
ncbi:MAG: hypothetical protein ACFE8U_16710 [Candidatus Hermodarchaeota archaeon]